MGIIRLMSALFRRLNAPFQRYAAIKRLRAENPGCTIESPYVQDSHLGGSVAVLYDAHLHQVSMGNFSYVSNDSILVNVSTGNFCSIGPHVQIGLGTHPSRGFVSTYPAFYSDSNEGCPSRFREDKVFDDSVPHTDIGSDVWIGANVIIPGGVQIGTGSIVAAGSVVVKDVPPYAVVGGNPAKVIRLRFSDEQIGLLLASNWWSWPIDKIHRHVDNFADIEKFRSIVKP